MKMKQRTRIMHSGDDFVTYNLNNKKDDPLEQIDVQLHQMKPQDHFIEAQVQEGDTLQAIALRFYCSISELKRINHIHKDNEIFARRTIKVPVSPYSVLTELIPSQTPEPVPSTSSHVSVNSVLQDIYHNNNPNVAVHQNNIVNAAAGVKENNDCEIDCNTVVLNSTLAPSVIQYTDTELNEQVSEDTQLLPNKNKEPVEAVIVKQLTSQGADFGLKWFHLMCFMLVLGVVVPLWYVMFRLDKNGHDALLRHPPQMHNSSEYKQ